MNSKQECIAKAYFDLFKEVSNADKEKRFNGIKNFIDDYGWLSGTLHDVDKNIIEFSGHEIRPKSLQGIENNNGWIKIESEDDLPNVNYAIYHVITKTEIFCAEPKNQNIEEYWGNDINKTAWWIENVTHYQPITKPTPPLY